MLNAIYIAAIGLQAQKEQLDASANNFANMNTSSFKRQSVDFSNILNRAPVHFAAAAASQPDAVSRRHLRFDMTPGVIQQTGQPLDVAIAGPGFFEVELPDGKVGYSRGGSLQVNAEGAISLADGTVLKSDIRIPGNSSSISVQADGSVTAILANDKTPTKLGQLDLVNFADAESLQYHGDGIFTAPDGATDPARGRPGVDGMSSLAPQSVEASNVGMTNEMVSLMLTERIFELNSRVAQAADEMMSMANNLRHA
jgi:flagellar basal-body rod protein FlgG